MTWIAPAFSSVDRGQDPEARAGQAATEVALRWSARTAQGAALLSIALGLSAGLIWQAID